MLPFENWIVVASPVSPYSIIVWDPKSWPALSPKKILYEPSAPCPAKLPTNKFDSACVLPPFWKALCPIAMFLFVRVVIPASDPAKLPIKNPWRSLPSVSSTPASLPILINWVLKS